jgi:hypothetical protein
MVDRKVISYETPGMNRAILDFHAQVVDEIKKITDMGCPPAYRTELKMLRELAGDLSQAQFYIQRIARVSRELEGL